ncbi:Hsp33 family molecular chaperone HslO [Lachnospiraceae bacterium NSJ-143]|nr:Hsp33 family molecular chaperone HslO [Lachnospiraceae bacterium NSJ-143]
MEDYILRATAANGSIRAFAAISSNTVEKARQIHNTSPVASAALGRMLTAAAIMGIMLKSEKDRLTLQITGDGPLKGILVTSDRFANVKGYAVNPYTELPLRPDGKLDVGGAVGNGSLRVIKDIGLKEPYSGSIELISGEIADDITYYYAASEQIPSSVGLGVLVDTDLSIKHAGGFIIQLMPGADDELVEKLEKKLLTIPYITDMLDSGYNAEKILQAILGDMGLEILDRVPVAYKCDCSRARVEQALISLGKKELSQIIDEDKKAELTCHFCNKVYNFDESELKKLLVEACSR